MTHPLTGCLIVFFFFFAMVFCLYLGNKVSTWQLARFPSEAYTSNKIAEGAIFALMGLLVALTFAGARERFDIRRDLVINEANALQTAYFRLDLLRAPTRTAVQQQLKQYVQLRLAIYQAIPDMDAAKLLLSQSFVLQNNIWQQSVSACQKDPLSSTCIVLLPSINAFIDLANARDASTQIHPPSIILATLIFLAVISAFMAGYGMKKNSTWHSVYVFIYILIVSFTISVIMNLEYPLYGFTKPDYFDGVMIGALERMG